MGTNLRWRMAIEKKWQCVVKRGNLIGGRDAVHAQKKGKGKNIQAKVQLYNQPYGARTRTRKVFHGLVSCSSARGTGGVLGAQQDLWEQVRQCSSDVKVQMEAADASKYEKQKQARRKEKQVFGHAMSGHFYLCFGDPS
ncbi:hypothetical protein ACMFMG_012199 [Clarireedia jacksonii]